LAAKTTFASLRREWQTTENRFVRRVVFFAFLVVGFFTQVVEVTADNQPNVVILFSDDQRADTIHALGNDVIKTPNLDKLVRNGVTFENAYIMGGFSPAVCCPSRAMLLSGKTLYHSSQGKTNWDCGHVIPPEHVSFPEVFREAGYNTLQTGKWHQDTEIPTRKGISLTMRAPPRFCAE
jgi:arylsulfatase A-like enzyme